MLLVFNMYLYANYVVTINIAKKKKKTADDYRYPRNRFKCNLHGCGVTLDKRHENNCQLVLGAVFGKCIYHRHCVSLLIHKKWLQNLQHHKHYIILQCRLDVHTFDASMIRLGHQSDRNKEVQSHGISRFSWRKSSGKCMKNWTQMTRRPSTNKLAYKMHGRVWTPRPSIHHVRP